MTLDGETHYRIGAFDRLSPFLMSIPSDSDLWMFVTSGGGLTAGRVDADGSLFPYQTVDQLHDAHHHTGPITLLRVERPSAAPVLWEPFATSGAGRSTIRRNLYKNTTGNRVVFEEVRTDLGLTFRYSWAACDAYGWVRTASLENSGKSPAQVTLLDGVRNVLPYGAPLGLYQQASNLVDAYKKSEVDPDTGLGIFSLTASITDRAEAAEMLRANTVWCCGLEECKVHLSLAAVDSFREGRLLPGDAVLNGARGNYLVSARIDLAPAAKSHWHIIGDTGQDQLRIAALRGQIQTDANLADRVSENLRSATANLRRNVASADGLQLSEQTIRSTHHFANVLFNNMRGGVFVENYECPTADFCDFLRVRNSFVEERHWAELERLPRSVPVQEIRKLAQGTGDADFVRLSYEYLPLHFSRRHGDPSRPWNRFSIRLRNEDGEKILSYEGNWRDVFQNWEALATAFPGFLPNIVAKFVNASTVDGFNPFRVNRDGVDWEVVNPDDPWSNIGYWGDHQIIYLLKLLEAWRRHDPAALGNTIGAEIFGYTDVPYRLKPYSEMIEDPSRTIVFDDDRASAVAARVAAFGTDGRLLADPDGTIHHANLFEKLLVPALSKLSNLVPDGGIWMNTQRPEWNDANNALASGGLSVVTMCYLRRYLAFLAESLQPMAEDSLPVATEIADWFEMISIALDGAQETLSADTFDAKGRKQLLDNLGQAFSAYRQTVYSRGFRGKTNLSLLRVIGLCTTATEIIDSGLAANKREDGLYHTYNMLQVSRDGTEADVARLPEMLEGQVAILSAGDLDTAAVSDVLKSLFASKLYQPDQRSFILYPERELPGFLGRNIAPAEDVTAIALLRNMLAAGDRTIVAKDADGVYRFAAEFGNERQLEAVLDRLAGHGPWDKAAARDREAVLALYEEVFRHKSFTGRSGTMYGYEGIGCVYWHMVAKLLLAVQENLLRAEREGQPQAACHELAQFYYRVRSGIGYERSVLEYGAFPADPYSHTPASGGAKQPGMTGQVKEEILTRRAELGVRIRAGKVNFAPVLLQREEFLHQDADFDYIDITGRENTLRLAKNSLAFTVCQVPVVYELTAGAYNLEVTNADGKRQRLAGNTLTAEASHKLFARSGDIAGIKVSVPRGALSRMAI